MYFHSIPYLHQCFGDVALPGSDACPYLAQAVPYQLSGFYMAVAHYIRIVDTYMYFPNWSVPMEASGSRMACCCSP